jgi:hypothetical protein
LNGPVYEMNADAIKTSPNTNNYSSLILTIAFAQRSFSDPRAATKRYAKSKRVLHRSASFNAASFSAIAELYSSISFYNEACNSLTIFYTASNFVVAYSNYSVDSAKALRFGSTY